MGRAFAGSSGLSLAQMKADETSHDGWTAFHWLCLHGLPSHYPPELHPESARALPDAYRPNPFGVTPPGLTAVAAMHIERGRS
ncbi:MAG: hypothetical protein ACI4PZ_03790 [Akkermansia sp.]